MLGVLLEIVRDNWYGRIFVIEDGKIICLKLFCLIRLMP